MRLPQPSSRDSRAPADPARIFQLAAAALAVCTAPAVAQTTTYTTNADFDLGTRFQVNYDAVPDQLQLDIEGHEIPFLYVAGFGDNGRILRIDADSGVVLGDYRSAPMGNETDPSRSSVDSRGNCWAVNRAEDTLGIIGSAVQVGIVVGGTRTNANGTPDPTGGYYAGYDVNCTTCVDRDGDGLIRTSMELGDVLAWNNTADGGTGGPAFVTSAEDECILLYQRTGCTIMRHASIDGNDDVWVGGYPQFDRNCFQRLSGIDGSVLETVVNMNHCGGFGGIVDPFGTLWSASPAQGQIMRFVPGSGGPVTCISAGTAPSGMAADSNGVVWVGAGNDLRRYDPAGAEILPTITLAPAPVVLQLRGVAVTTDNHVWTAAFAADQVIRVNQAGTIVAVIPTDETPNGLSVDSRGRVWVVNLEAGNVERIDPVTNMVDMTVQLGGASLPFTLSEFTGSVAVTSMLPTGNWTVIQDGGMFGAIWGRVFWTSVENSGSSIDVFARSADFLGDLPNVAYTQVQNGVQTMLTGRFIQVQARFTKAPNDEVSPILKDLSIEQLQETTPPDPPCIDYNRRNPGSLLLFPEFDNRAGVVTILTVTDVDCNSEDFDVEFIYIDETDCHEFNRTHRMTPCDTLTLLTRFHNPNDEQGYVYAFAKDRRTGEPSVRNSLIGNLLVVDGLDSFEYSVNPVVFKGIGDGSITNLDGDSVRDLDGIEYEMAPDVILVPRFLGQAPSGPPTGPGGTSQLILIALTGGKEFTTRLDFLIYNDNEEVFSSEYEFYCWAKPNLLDISGVFANNFLQNWTNHDPDEILGAPFLESGWMRIDGAVASSIATSIHDPAFYAVLVERIGSHAAADLPFEYCSQDNGGLVHSGIFGDQ